jgi:hypothetical protein
MKQLMKIAAMLLVVCGSSIAIAQAPSVPTPVFDLSLGTTQFIRLTANVTSSTVTNPTNGQVYTFVIEQDGTGGRGFVWPTQFQQTVQIDAFDGTANANTNAVQQFVYIKSVNKYFAVSSLIANQ